MLTSPTGRFVRPAWSGNPATTKGETMDHTERLEYLRQELRAERISLGELAELQGLAEHIAPGDIELLEAAGVPEHGEEEI
jgi:hypothetical protein